MNIKRGWRMPVIVIVVVALSVVVGILGRKTFIGFWGNFIFSLFFTPVPPMIYILLTRAWHHFFAREAV